MGVQKQDQGSTIHQLCHFACFSTCERMHLFYKHVLSSCYVLSSHCFTFYQLCRHIFGMPFFHFLLWCLSATWCFKIDKLFSPTSFTLFGVKSKQKCLSCSAILLQPLECMRLRAYNNFFFVYDEFWCSWIAPCNQAQARQGLLCKFVGIPVALLIHSIPVLQHPGLPGSRCCELCQVFGNAVETLSNTHVLCAVLT